MIRTSTSIIRSRRAALLLIAVPILAFPGCGSSGSDDSTSTAALTKAQFIKQGDAICASVDKIQSDAVTAYVKAHPLGKERAPKASFINEAVLLPMQREIEELKSLNPPTADKKEVEAILVSMGDGLEKSEEEPIALLNGKIDTFKEANQSAAKYGFKVCSKAP